MLRVLLYGFLFYLLCQFIFRFVIPVYKTTKQVKKGFKKMRDQMNESAGKQQPPGQSKSSSDNFAKEPVGEYIDFEEIK